MKKVILTGPESTGKTTLVRLLASHYQVPLVLEKARDFLEKKRTASRNKRNLKQYFEVTQKPIYNYEDLSEIARLQNEMENITWNNENRFSVVELPFIMCDTDLLTIKIWANVVFGKCPDWILQDIQNQSIKHSENLYLLCSPEGVPWEEDPLRENPHDRERLFDIYEKELIFYKKNYKILRGPLKGRMALAIDAVDSFF
jgi:nicotinamide riboside kinase